MCSVHIVLTLNKHSVYKQMNSMINREITVPDFGPISGIHYILLYYNKCSVAQKRTTIAFAIQKSTNTTQNPCACWCARCASYEHNQLHSQLIVHLKNRNYTDRTNKIGRYLYVSACKCT